MKLTWQPGTNGRKGRWRKKYRGKSYYFNGGSGESDRQARQQAVLAWEKRKTQLDARVHEPDYQEAIQQWQDVLDAAQEHGEDQIAEEAQGKLKELRRRLKQSQLSPLAWDDGFLNRFEVHPKIAATIREFFPPPPRDPDALIVPADNLLLGQKDVKRAVWQDRLQRPKRLAADDSLAAQVAAYVALKQQEAQAGTISSGHVNGLRLYLDDLVERLGAAMPIAKLDEAALVRYHSHALKQVAAGRWARTTAAHRLSAVKSFVRSAWRSRLIEQLPRNLGEMQVTTDAPAIEIFSKQEVKKLLAKAPPLMKLCCLLALNCAMTSRDIGDLKHQEVDWAQGRITRKRSKTRDQKNTPTVSYKLWPSTFKLLKQMRSKHPELAILNRYGSPLWYEELGANGKYVKRDAVRNGFLRLREAAGVKGVFKMLKKTSASMLADSPYESVVQLFLGHSPGTIAARHYARPAQAMLDEALPWLAKQLGLRQLCQQGNLRGLDDNRVAVDRGFSRDEPAVRAGDL